MASAPGTAAAAPPQAGSTHESFLRHARFRWLKISSLICIVCVLGYVLADVKPRPNGGSWYGYTLGTIGALLILWLSLLGIRKRSMTPGNWSLKAWTSAHVYLGLALVTIGTLHTGFQLGWNVHTLAYALMMLVVISGMFGVAAYGLLPPLLSNNRGEMTEAQMLGSIRAIDRQLRDAAQPLARGDADLVLAALAQGAFDGRLWARLAGRLRGNATQAAIDGLGQGDAGGAADPAIRRVRALLVRRRSQLSRVRRHLRYKALLEIWLYVHIPSTIALIAALAAHIISIFYYW
jgi:hypothetical protein